MVGSFSDPIQSDDEARAQREKGYRHDYEYQVVHDGGWKNA
jgi:hypothetical protein